MVVVLVTPKDERARNAAEVLYGELLEAGADALLDDRDERPGVKFRDAELTGIPCRVAVGSRDLADGVVEFAARLTGEKERVPVDQAVTRVRRHLTEQPASAAGSAP